MTQRIYIAGKITHLDPAEAYELFLQAENVICNAGHVPLHPMKLVDQTPGRTYNEYLLDALKVMMLEADAVYFLDNAAESKGARIERFIATELGMPQSFSFDEIPVARKQAVARKQTVSTIFGKTPLL